MRRRENHADGEERQEIEAELAHYPNRQAVCIDAMKIVQRHRGWVSDESFATLANCSRCRPPIWMASPLLQPDLPQAGRPARDHALRQRELLDHGLRTHARASYRATRYRSSGETTADGRFTLLPIVCLGACDHAPAMMIDDDMHGDLTRKRSTSSWRQCE